MLIFFLEAPDFPMKKSSMQINPANIVGTPDPTLKTPKSIANVIMIVPLTITTAA